MAFVFLVPGFVFSKERCPKKKKNGQKLRVGAALRRSPNKVSVPEEV